MSRVSRAWSKADDAELAALCRGVRKGRLTVEVAQLRFERLMGRRRRWARVVFGPRRAFRRSL